LITVRRIRRILERAQVLEELIDARAHPA
jgi:hypothetical protein